MRTILSGLVWICLVALPLATAAQERKPGLYELTVITTTVSPSASKYPPRVSMVCLTQQMIDKYGAIVPDNLARICQFSNIVKKPGAMSADLVCSGPLHGKGTLAVNWFDSEHAKGTINFSGSMHPTDSDIKIEWSATTSSVYKGPDCGILTPPAASTAPAPAAPPPQ